MIETGRYELIKSQGLTDSVLFVDPIKLKMKFTYFYTVLNTEFLGTGFTGK